jgi:hypothetical protein
MQLKTFTFSLNGLANTVLGNLLPIIYSDVKINCENCCEILNKSGRLVLNLQHLLEPPFKIRALKSTPAAIL